MRDAEKTIQSVFNIWFFNFQNPSFQQYSNLYHSTVAIIKFFNEENKHDNKLTELRKLFFNPILILGEKYGEIKLPKKPLDWDISKLEFIYFRDSRFRLKMGSEYFIDTVKVQETKKLSLGDMVTILSLFKLELFAVMIEILIESKLNIYISLPTGTTEVKQLGSDDIV